MNSAAKMLPLEFYNLEQLQVSGWDSHSGNLPIKTQSIQNDNQANFLKIVVLYQCVCSNCRKILNMEKNIDVDSSVLRILQVL